MNKSKTQVKTNHQLSIRCQCSIVKDGFKVNSKKKSKLSQILLQPNKNILKIINIVTQKETETFQFPIIKLKAIHRKFIDEGKITIQFYSHSEAVILRGLDMCAENNQKEVNSQIFIDNASKENLQLLISNLSELRKKLNPPKQKVEEKSQKQKVQGKQIKRKPQFQEQEIMSRKDIMKMIKNEGKPAPKAATLKKVEKKKQKVIQFMNLPVIILNQIFGFCRFKLQYRLVSRQFGSFILKNILNLKLKDDVDESSFNTLSKWTINVSCRMKNVKNLQLSDRYDFQELVPNQAKTLKFGNWKEISSRNIDQMKGLRIYSLQIPYLIKFPISHINGLRMVELRLKGKNITVKNSHVNDDELTHLVNGIKDLKYLQIPYCSSKLLMNIKQPEKMKEIKIGVLNEKNCQEKWVDFSSFMNLNYLYLESLQTQGIFQKSENEIKARKIEFPPNLISLAIGSYFSPRILLNLPLKIENLKLIGDQFRNRDLFDVYLPNLKVLDISESPYLNPECLQSFSHIKVYTNWERDKAQYANNFYRPQSIQIFTYRN